MKYLKKLSWILLASVAVLSGCTESNIVSPSSGLVEGDGVPNLEIDKNTPINWEELTEDVRDVYMDPYGPFGEYVLDMAVTYDSNSETVTILLPVTHKTTPEIAAIYGADVLRTTGDTISVHNFYYKAPDQTSDEINYGSFFDEHDVVVQVFYYDDENDLDAYLVNDTMKAGEHRALVPRAQ